MLSAFLKKLLFARQFFMMDGKIEILGTKNVLFSSHIIASIQDTPSFYKKVKELVKEDTAGYAEKIGMERQGFAKSIGDIFELYGLGKISIVDMDMEKKRTICHIANSPIAISYIEQKKKSAKPCCLAISAVLAGIFSFVFDKDVDAEEKNCIVKGDNFCEFVIK